jgi:hypothetical protein
VWFGGRPVYGTLGGPTREEIAHVNGLWERVIELAQVPDVSAAPDPDPLIALLEADDPHTDYPSVLLDIPDAGPVPAIEADRIPQEWRARGEALVAWHRAGAVTAMDARYDRPWHGLGIWRAHVALATEPGDGSHVAAVLALAHALRTRGLLIDGYVGTQMCLQAAQTATARGIPADAAWQRWRPHSGEVTGMLAREAVSAATLLGEYMSPGRFSGLARVFAEAERYEVRRVFASNVLAASHNTDPEAMALALADAATDARGYFASMMAQGDRSPLPRAIADAIAAFDAMPAR